MTAYKKRRGNRLEKEKVLFSPINKEDKISEKGTRQQFIL